MKSKLILTLSLLIFCLPLTAIADPSGKIEICHKAGTKSERVLTINPEKDGPKHFGHGDYATEEETCNGMDSDCDGVADNFADCSDGVACTDDSCDGILGCANEPNDFNCAADEYCDAATDCTALAVGFCGDSVLDDGEECDDGNTAAGDFCSATCELEEDLCPCSNVIVANGLSYWDLACDRFDNGPYDFVFDSITTVYVSAPIDLDGDTQPITPPIAYYGPETECLDSLETFFGQTYCSRHAWESNTGRLISRGGQNSVGTSTSLAAQACRKQLTYPDGD